MVNTYRHNGMRLTTEDNPAIKNTYGHFFPIHNHIMYCQIQEADQTADQFQYQIVRRFPVPKAKQTNISTKRISGGWIH